MEPASICLISCLHSLYDDRIYWKIALSLKKRGYCVYHLGVSSKNESYSSEHDIKMISIKRSRYFKNDYLDKLFRLITFRPNIYKKLYKIAVSLNANIYHLHDLQLNRIGPALKKLSLSTKVIYDVHEPYPITLSETTSQNPFVQLTRKIYGRHIAKWEIKKSVSYDQIITTEENVAERFKKKLPRLKVDVVYNYSDLNHPAGFREKKFDFIYTGAIRKRRGVFEIIKAVKMLKDEGFITKTLFLGDFHDNNLKQQVEELILANNLNNEITLKPSVPYCEIMPYYQMSRCGLAVFNECEVNRTILPIKIFEYIVMHLPVIASNFGHLKSITEKNNTGILVEPDNMYKLSHSLKKIIANNNYYNKLVDNCVIAAKKYRWELMEQRLYAIYEHVLKQ